MQVAPIFSSDMALWQPISREIWTAKYQLKDNSGRPVDLSWTDTVARVARAAAMAEQDGQRRVWEQRFADAIADFAFIPGGRILAGAGSERAVTLFNCFVMGRIEDDLSSIFENVREAALTLQMGGGIGHDFSTLRPKGALVASIGADASGPVSFMDVWNSMCRTIMSAGQRRGAMMATLMCDHPDIELFIEAKRDPAGLRNFNLSVLVTDEFIAAVRKGEEWPLRFGGEVVRKVDARDLWQRLMRATYEVAEPGVIFLDRVNEQNNLAYCETIAATNPCGEQPLPYHGACLLGALNLAAFIDEPFSANARCDVARLAASAAVAVRFLDNAIDISRYPLAAQQREAKAKRRIGLGVTGLADALIMTGLNYGSPEARAVAGSWLSAIKEASYAASLELAKEKGAFALSDPAQLSVAPNVTALPGELRAEIARVGLRNGCLTTIAPTGTTSLLAGNVSSGIEPVFAARFERRRLNAAGEEHVETIEDLAWRVMRERGGSEADLKGAFVTAEVLSPRQHLEMQAAAQALIDSAISKTINVAEDMPFEEFAAVYLEAFDLGLKGCTTYRPNRVTGAVLTKSEGRVAAVTDGKSSNDTGHRTNAAAEREPAMLADRKEGDDRGDGTLKRENLPAKDHYMAPRRGQEIVFLAQPRQRDSVLEGRTYKLRWPRSEHALYITINDIEVERHRRPFEIFINTKNLEHHAWTVALTRMISAVFRRGGDVSFVVEELRAVFDPQGGAWIEGRYVPSLLAAIGDVIDRHLQDLRCVGGAGAEEARQEATGAALKGDPVVAALRHGQSGTAPVGSGVVGAKPDSVVSEPGTVTYNGLVQGMRDDGGRRRVCPKCNQVSLSRIGGCWMCSTCSYSLCD